MADGIGVGVVGLGFGREFVPLYLSHPSVHTVAICDPDERALAEYGDRFGVQARYHTLDALLGDEAIDAVHLVTPVHLHAEQAIRVLNAGRHCATAVPMGLELDELYAVVAAAQASHGTFMMMETAVYQREYFYAQALRDAGRMGELTFLRGVHLRDRMQMPDYWRGFPPLKYATHAISPLLALAGARAHTVHAFGSGRLEPELADRWGNPFPLETAIFSLDGSDVTGEVTQGAFHTARSEQEGFSAYGRRMSVEWAQQAGDGLSVFEMDDVDPLGDRFRTVESRRINPPDDVTRLPPELAPFVGQAPFDGGHGAEPYVVHGHHGGSHPHLVHEFVSSAVAGRAARIDEITAADWCAVGICGHESALNGGSAVRVPDFRAATSAESPPTVGAGTVR